MGKQPSTGHTPNHAERFGLRRTGAPPDRRVDQRREDPTGARQRVPARAERRQARGALRPVRLFARQRRQDGHDQHQRRATGQAG